MAEGTAQEKTVFERSVQTAILVHMLEECEEGAVVTWEAITAALGSPYFMNRSFIQSARRIMLNEKKVRFETLFKRGLKRVSPSEALEASSSLVQRIGRLNRREQNKLTAIPWERLNKDERDRWNLYATTTRLIEQMTKRKTQRELEEKVRRRQSVLPPPECINLFKNDKSEHGFAAPSSAGHS